jgi:hypothetical protein
MLLHPIQKIQKVLSFQIRYKLLFIPGQKSCCLCACHGSGLYNHRNKKEQHTELAKPIMQINTVCQPTPPDSYTEEEYFVSSDTPYFGQPLYFCMNLHSIPLILLLSHCSHLSSFSLFSDTYHKLLYIRYFYNPISL